MNKQSKTQPTRRRIACQNTEWLQGTIRLKQDEKGIRAWYQEQPLT